MTYMLSDFFVISNQQRIDGIRECLHVWREESQWTLAFERRTDGEDGKAAGGTELGDRRLQEKQRHAHQHKRQQVRDQERPCDAARNSRSFYFSLSFSLVRTMR